MIWRVLLAITAVVAIGAVVVIVTGGDDGDDGLPPVGRSAPTDYRILYAVTTPDSTSTEERIVHRPFGARITTRDASGQVSSQRWSDLGRLTTRSQGDEAIRIDTAIAPAASDMRPDLFTGPMTDLKRLAAGSSTDIGGRPCTRSSEGEKVATAGQADQSLGDTGSLPVKVTRCVDAQGLVLEERWASPGGRNLLTKRAVELELGDDVPAIDEPKAQLLPDEQGNGSVRQVAADAPVPFAESFHLATPKGFTFVGRYAVVPARIARSSGAAVADPGVALYTDVWRRGPDVLLLDQGTTTSGSAPFDSSTKVGPIDVTGLGAAELAVDLRVAEVRFTRPGGGFVRLAGTLAPPELVRLAAKVTQVQPAR
jgi:hypothetical protein